MSNAKTGCEQFLLYCELIDAQKSAGPLLQDTRRHLEGCPECKESFELMQSLDRIIIDKFQQIEVSPALSLRIMEGVKLGRLSGIRQIIYDVVKSKPGHLLPGEIVERVRHKLPAVTSSRVSSNLSWLVSRCLLRRFDDGEGAWRYDTNTAPHSHFYCCNCRCFFDLPEIAPASIPVSECEVYQVTEATAVLRGLCRDCGSE